MITITQLRSFLDDAEKRFGSDVEIHKNYVTANIILVKGGEVVAAINPKTEDMEIFDETDKEIEREMAPVVEGPLPVLTENVET